ncbi:hypothetical protein AMATHDRAFT_46668 [Amanita thiersii Skay4041]|uniref:Peptidase A1 domain-containing protein n=1 Tax=Amanita thiersii Skay4041 TaxID=703135 RepID=A0A2A9NWA6_9AGAR|nr:hypothetical protein AMATHDRAFT_46668 [Amanita thiersii Skay4041]
MSFGGKAWTILPDDMVIAQVPQTTMCVGGIFDLTMGTNIEAGSGNPSWVVGDTFLKNVYSVFRSNPPSIGFAQLSQMAGGSGAGSPPTTNGSSVLTSTPTTPVRSTSTLTVSSTPTNATGSNSGAKPSSSASPLYVVDSILFTLFTSLLILCFT